jgi:mono/diheme cytochrome c family protein
LILQGGAVFRFVPRIVLGLAATGVVLLTTAPRGRAAAQHANADPEAARALLKQYCAGCHSEAQRQRGVVPVAFDQLDPSDLTKDAKVWETVVRKMRAGVMPPSGMPRPDAARHDAFLDWLEQGLDRAAEQHLNPGRTEPFHRLNRTQYQHAIRDLLHVDVDVASLLPADDSSYGFDNIAGVLKLSPTLVERYLSAAQKISRLAVGTAPPSPTVDYFRIADDLAQDRQLPGQSFGTRGGTKIHYTFPMDAQYGIRVQLSRDLNEGIPVYTEDQQLEISVDGERATVFTLPGVGGQAAPAEPAQDFDSAAPAEKAEAPAPQGRGAAAGEPQVGRRQPIAPRGGPRLSRQGMGQRNRIDRDWEVRVPVKAGPHDVEVTFINATSTLPETARLPFQRPYPAGVNIAETRTGAYLRSVEISGPHDPTGPGASPSREQIFVCHPAKPSDESACAKTIFATLARHAYRRPVTDTDLDPLLSFYSDGRKAGTFDEGVERGLRRLLISPEFLLRVETDPQESRPNTPHRISDLELASRLAFFLWDSLPDDELIAIAGRGQLRRPEVLSGQVRRMVADPRFDRFVESFGAQWLYLRNLAAVVPVQQSFPDFDDTLRQAFRHETELFLQSVVREDRSALDLLRADYTFVNERLARHYGIPNVTGSRFRRVTLPAETNRRGLLGQGSILTVTSYPDRTSPVVRGKWILENLLGAPPPAPPPNVPELKPNSFATQPLSMRERMAAHRKNPPCAGCHSMMDPLGFALEHFDGVGKWRTLDESGGSIDASGAMPDGTKFDGAAGLAQALLQSDRFVSTLTEKMLTYALGRGLEYYDAPAVRAIVRDSAKNDYRFSSIILGVVQSTPFQMRMTQPEPPAGQRARS